MHYEPARTVRNAGRSGCLDFFTGFCPTNIITDSGDSNWRYDGIAGAPGSAANLKLRHYQKSAA